MCENKSESLLITYPALVSNRSNFKLKLLCENKLNQLEGYRLQFLVEECDIEFYVGRYVHTYSNESAIHLKGKRVKCTNKNAVVEDDGEKEKMDESQLITFPALALNIHNFKIKLIDEEKITGMMEGYRIQFLVEECDIAAYVGTYVHTFANDSAIRLKGKRVRCSIKNGVVEDDGEKDEYASRCVIAMERKISN